MDSSVHALPVTQTRVSRRLIFIADVETRKEGRHRILPLIPPTRSTQPYKDAGTLRHCSAVSGYGVLRTAQEAPRGILGSCRLGVANGVQPWGFHAVGRRKQKPVGSVIRRLLPVVSV